jgi:hypothetical protein
MIPPSPGVERPRREVVPRGRAPRAGRSAREHGARAPGGADGGCNDRRTRGALAQDAAVPRSASSPDTPDGRSRSTARRRRSRSEPGSGADHPGTLGAEHVIESRSLVLNGGLVLGGVITHPNQSTNTPCAGTGLLTPAEASSIIGGYQAEGTATRESSLTPAAGPRTSSPDLRGSGPLFTPERYPRSAPPPRG